MGGLPPTGPFGVLDLAAEAAVLQLDPATALEGLAASGWTSPISARDGFGPLSDAVQVKDLVTLGAGPNGRILLDPLQANHALECA